MFYLCCFFSVDTEFFFGSLQINLLNKPITSLWIKPRLELVSEVGRRLVDATLHRTLREIKCVEITEYIKFDINLEK